MCFKYTVLAILRRLAHNVLGSTETEMSLKVGYARTSTLEQQAGLDAQIRDLAAAGCEKTFSEQVSAVGKRPHLEAALEFTREGDTLVVTKLAASLGRPNIFSKSPTG